MIRTNRATFTLLAALVLGWLWDLLFYGKMGGISVPLCLLLLTALFGLGWRERLRPRWRNLWLILPLLFFAAMVAVRANPFLTALNVTACLALLGLLAHLFFRGRVERLGLVAYPLILLYTAADALVQSPLLLASSVDLPALRQRGGHNLLPVARGCLLALPILILFAGLLASADLVFARYLEDILGLAFLRHLAEWAWRGLLALGVAWGVAGGLAHALNRHDPAGPDPRLETLSESLGGVCSLGFVEAATLLTSIDLLFLAFVWIQFTYLFGGQANVSVEGYTYAEYARRGYFELLAASLLALGLILLLHSLTRRHGPRQEGAFAALGSLMVLSVLVMLASAFQRLLLYEDAFGYTELRLYGYVSMVWLAFTFVWFLVLLWLRSGRFAFGLLLAALGFLITLNAINPDPFIARQNLARYQETGKLDLHYLTTLSEDVVPVLVGARADLGGDQRQALDAHLRRRLGQMQEHDRWRGWQSFHLSRGRAYDLLLESQTQR